MTKDDQNFISEELLTEIPYFENFLDRIGFKRVDGAVFGLLVLSSRSLCSEEIEKTLGLSQSAVSQSLKNLHHFGALETTETRVARVKYHSAKQNALSIVASVFRKREQESILEFKQMAERSLKKSQDSRESLRSQRLQSIISTCQLAEEVIQFVFHLAKIENQDVFKQVVSRVPKAFNLMLATAAPLGQASQAFGQRFKESLLDGFTRFTSESKSKDSL